MIRGRGFFLFNVLLIVMILLVGTYVFFRTRKFFPGDTGTSSRIRLLSWLIPAAMALTAVFLCRSIWGFGTVLVLHLVLFSALLDLLALLFRKILAAQREHGIYRFFKFGYRYCLFALLIVTVLLSYGAYNMKRIHRTQYTIESEKITRPYRIALLTDVHYGTIQEKDLLKEHIATINGENPDLVLLGGDLVDEQTSKENMEEIFHVLGGLKSTFGTYYVYGNHDRQAHTSEPAFTPDELEHAITSNGIRILEDSLVTPDSRLILIGRADASWNRVAQRASLEKLMADVDPGCFVLVLDHQPLEFEEAVEQGVDLILSGHTHAGQIWPVGLLISVFGPNYGLYHHGTGNLIVSSGFTGWGYPVRTQGHCEYVIVDLIPER